jgi:hypothetical protein
MSCARSATAPPGGGRAGRSWVRLTDQLGQSFLVGGDEPPGDVGV